MPEIDFTTWDNRFGAFHQGLLNLDSPIIRAVDHHYVWTEWSDAAGGWVAMASGLSIATVIGSRSARGTTVNSGW